MTIGVSWSMSRQSDAPSFAFNDELPVDDAAADDSAVACAADFQSTIITIGSGRQHVSPST